MAGTTGNRGAGFLIHSASSTYCGGRFPTEGRIPMSKRLLLAAALLALPASANAQSDWFSATQPTYQGFYVGAEGGLNWLLNNQSYLLDTGWALGGKVRYDLVGPPLELEGMYH